MRLLALIPARGGSKRLPGKNMRLLGGKPLISWSIEAVKGIPEICDCLVSTDDAAIADMARASGALVPWLRPAALASDTAGSVEVALHALDWYEGVNGPVDGLLLLQPTSPFRRHETLIRGIQLFQAHPETAVIGISPTHHHPHWTFHIQNQSLQPFMDHSHLNTRSQDLPPAYVINGGFYLIAPATLSSHQSFFPPDTRPLIMDAPGEKVDIDTAEDFAYAEFLLKEASAVANRGCEHSNSVSGAISMSPGQTTVPESIRAREKKA